MDINNAFLHGNLDEDIYMTPPDGYAAAPNLVCKLERSLYGLTRKLTDFSFRQSVHNQCLFLKPSPLGPMALIVYVDDVLVTGPSIADISQVKTYLYRLFTIKDLGDTRYFLGLEIARGDSGIFISQTKYIMDIIRDTGLVQAKSVSTPPPTSLKLSSASVVVLGLHSPPKFSQSVYLTQPCDAHWHVALHVNSFALRAFCDADWASCVDSKCSLTGFCVFLGDALVSWKTKKQPTISRSTAEAEYCSLAATVYELRWLSYILAEFDIPLSLPIYLFCDNKAMLHILVNPVFHERTKHIELDCHLVRDAYKEGFISPSFVSSSLQLADIFTKSLPLKSFALIRSKLGLVLFDTNPTCGGMMEYLSSSSSNRQSSCRTQSSKKMVIRVKEILASLTQDKSFFA
ncbi:UNVERIFIED_CONTAM: Retrovirus-related Pol polyprotein from transposon RE2 [Sesamum indicum]